MKRVRIGELTPVFKRSWGFFMRESALAQARVGSSLGARVRERTSLPLSARVLTGGRA